MKPGITRSSTEDRGPPGGAVIHTVEQLGPNSHRLPNGSLLYKNVPLARTGWMMYGPRETPIKTNDSGIAYVERDADTLFQDATIGSCVGAAIVNDHPPVDVTPGNWKNYAHGICLEARRGTGDDSDVILGDLLITDSKLIDEVLKGKREISLGYDADYMQTGDGLGRQSNIIVNHVALVGKGRCGARCAIGDEDSVSTLNVKDLSMTAQRVNTGSGTRRRAVFDGLRKSFEDADALLNEDGEDSNDTHIHIHADGERSTTGDQQTADAAQVNDRLAVVEDALESIASTLSTLTDAVAGLTEAPAGRTKTGDDDGSSKEGDSTDSRLLETGFKKVMAQAEVLIPGFRLPTFDAAAKMADTVESMCNLRRKVLDAAYQTTDGAALINGVTGEATLTLDGMGCKDVAVIFNAAATVKATANNAAAKARDGAMGSHQSDDSKAVKTGPKSIAEINAANEAFWAAQQKLAASQ